MKSYLRAKGQDIARSMSSALIATMFHELDLDRYLLEPECDRHAGVYANAVQSWNSGTIHKTYYLCEVAKTAKCDKTIFSVLGKHIKYMYVVFKPRFSATK